MFGFQRACVWCEQAAGSIDTSLLSGTAEFLRQLRSAALRLMKLLDF